MKDNTVAAVTICSINYLGKALTLADSYRKHHAGHDFYIVIVDRRGSIKHDFGDVKIIWVDELGVPDFERKAFEFDVIEFNTNVKPSALTHLLKLYNKVLYIDPDVFVYSYLEPVFSSLDSSSIVVTPHSITPINDRKKPDDVDFLRFGTFNLGFIALSQCSEAFLFLEWWSDRCLEYGFYEPQSGLAVDQKWVNLAPALCQNLKVLHDIGLNVSFWNLHERALSFSDECWLVNNKSPLYFIHFSSFDAGISGLVAKKQTRFPIGSRADFELAASVYRAKLIENINIFSESIPYGFDYFDDGTYITPALRRVYSSVKDIIFPSHNPFDGNGAVHKFAKRQGLLEKSNQASSRTSFHDVEKFGWQRKVILRCLKLILRLIGPARYFVLMRYLAHISSIRNQGEIFLR
jgi:hypothetical protein